MAEPDAVARFRCESAPSSISEGMHAIDVAYGARAVVILSAALSRNQATLNDMVAPDATFQVARGDTITGPRGKGPVAAISFAAAVTPFGYEVRIPVSGPLAADPCGLVLVNILLIDKNDEEAQQLTFRFQRGMLAAVDGTTVSLGRGVFAKAQH